MIPRVKPLPHWVLTDLQPAFYDTEAVTVLELLSKIYGKINELVEDYNAYVDEVNQIIADLSDNEEEFQAAMQQAFDNFVLTVNQKLAEQDADIADAINYMKTNLIATVTNLYEAGFANGDYVSQVSLSYDEDTETIEILDTMEKAEDEEY